LWAYFSKSFIFERNKPDIWGLKAVKYNPIDLTTRDQA
jgi:hypothetical protein